MKYEVVYHYYKYNSGNSDNGLILTTKEFYDLDEATSMITSINNCINGVISEEEQNKIKDLYMIDDGYFTGRPELYAVEKVKLI